MVGSLLEKDFFDHLDVVSISKNLLGKVLVTNFDGLLTAGKIVETEAYRAPDDKACHAYNNRRTKRTEVMFAEAGVAYIYLCYGIHHLFNVVTGPKDTAHAVLIRAIEPIDGIDTMLARRNFKKVVSRLTAGPGALSKALGIQKSYTGIGICEKNLIWIEDRNMTCPESNILASPRVGVGYAEECADWNWRFRIRNSQWTSPAK